MSREAVVVGRRSRAEIARLAGMYATSGMGQGEFRFRRGTPLSALNRHLNKQRQRNHAGNEGGNCALVEVEMSTSVVPATLGEPERWWWCCRKAAA
ncbi:MAG: hypothetical protein ACP5E5_12830 [Acidobacteriaceae bacterium]